MSCLSFCSPLRSLVRATMPAQPHRAGIQWAEVPSHATFHWWHWIKRRGEEAKDTCELSDRAFLSPGLSSSLRALVHVRWAAEGSWQTEKWTTLLMLHGLFTRLGHSLEALSSEQTSDITFIFYSCRLLWVWGTTWTIINSSEGWNLTLCFACLHKNVSIK